MLQLEKTTIRIGLEKPLKILHVSDTHLAFFDENDTERIRSHGSKRDSDAFLSVLNEQIAYAEENCDLLVHTGDLIDFVTRRCVDSAREILKNEKIHFVAGNHEYWRCDGQMEDMNYRIGGLLQIGQMGGIGAELFFTSRIVGGVNFVGIDDGYHQVEDGQLKRLRMEVEKGYPVILFMHAPLYEKELYKRSLEFWKGEICLTGSDASAHPEVAGSEQEPTAATKAFVDYVNSEKRIKAVLAGHLHFPFESALPGGTMQYVAGRGSNGYAREITIL